MLQFCAVICHAKDSQETTLHCGPDAIFNRCCMEIAKYTKDLFCDKLLFCIEASM